MSSSSKVIPYSTQCIDDEDLAAVTAVLRSSFLTSGPKVPAFEDSLKSFIKVPYACAVSSATAGLHLSMLALGVKEGDLVLVSSISFCSSANCARMAGAEVDFIDVDPLTGLIDFDKFEAQLETLSAQGRKVKAVVAVHLSGRPLDLGRLYYLKEKYGFYLIEDAAHALGAEYQGKMIGSYPQADAVVYSFHPVKIITTAEGGAVATFNRALHDKICALRSHGIEHDKLRLERKDKPPYYYEMQDLGFNYRLSDVHAALGISQMEKVEEFLSKRREQARYYQEILQDCPHLTCPPGDTEDNQSSWHLYQILTDRRDGLYAFLRSKNVLAQVHYVPIYAHPYYQKLKAYPPLPGAEAFFNATLSIPLHPKLTSIDQSMIASWIREFLSRD